MMVKGWVVGAGEVRVDGGVAVGAAATGCEGRWWWWWWWGLGCGFVGFLVAGWEGADEVF